MIILLVFTLLSPLINVDDLLDNSSQYILSNHKMCVDFLTNNRNLSTALQSVICGAELHDFELKSSLNKTSLLHLFIISGSHLLSIDNVLTKLRLPFALRFSLICFYAIITRLQAPALRALFSLMQSQFTKKKNWIYPNDLHTLICGLIVLIFFTTLWDSRSLQLSWLASLGIGTYRLFSLSPVKRLICSQICIYLFVAPALYGFGNLHPLSIIFNITLGSLLGIFLLPTALMAAIHESLSAPFSLILELISFCAHSMTDPSLQSQHKPLPNTHLWVWIFFLHFLIILIRLISRTGRDSQRNL